MKNKSETDLRRLQKIIKEDNEIIKESLGRLVSPYNCDPNWKAWNGKTCGFYEQHDYCKKDGDHYGSGWRKGTWGSFEGWSDDKGRTALVCPQCGCQVNTTAASQIDLVSRFTQFITE